MTLDVPRFFLLVSRAASIAALFGFPTGTHAQFSITSVSGTTGQTFDALATTGSSPWEQDVTLDGWFLYNSAIADIADYNASNGDTNTGHFYSFGLVGDAERALGGTASGSAYFGSPASGAIAGWIAFAATNNSGGTLNQFTLGFDGEQWRNGGNTSAQAMVLEYGFGASFVDVATWTTPGGNFDWSSPATGASAAPINGNVEGLVADRGGNISGLTWLTGETLWIRWTERNDVGNDHGLGIDDFTFSWLGSSTAIPLYWDPNGAGAGVGGSGSWDATSLNWNSTSTGSGVAQTFNNSAQAIFGGAGGTVTIATNGVTANGGLVFDSAGYTVGGGRLTLGGNPTIRTAFAAIINAVIDGINGLTKSGPAPLTLGGANTFTGNVAISAGSLIISSDAALGNVANDIALGGGVLAPSASITLPATRKVSGSGGLEIPPDSVLTTQGAVAFGTLALTSGSLTHATGGTLVLNGPNNTAGNILFADPVNIQAPNSLVLTGNLAVSPLAATVTVQGNIVASNAAHTFDVADGTTSVDLQLTGNLSSPGIGGRITKSGTGTLRVQGDSAGLLGGWRLGLAGSTVVQAGRLLIGSKEALGTSPGLQVFFNDGTIEAETALTGPNALPVGLSFGAGLETAAGSGIFTSARLAGSPMEFTGTTQLFKPAGISSFEHRVVVDTEVTLTGPFDSSTGTSSTGVTVSGTGSLKLNAAANGVNEPVTVSGTRLVVNGSLAASTVLVKAGGTLSGTGSLNGLVTIGDGVTGGTLSPGEEIGSLTAFSLAFEADATLVIQLSTSTRTTDSLILDGPLQLGAGVATLSLTDPSTAPLPFGTELRLIENRSTGPSNGFFDGLPDRAQFTLGTNLFEIDYGVGSDGNDAVLRALPEPGVSVLAILAGATLSFRRRRAPSWSCVRFVPPRAPVKRSSTGARGLSRLPSESYPGLRRV